MEPEFEPRLSDPEVHELNLQVQSVAKRQDVWEGQQEMSSMREAGTRFWEAMHEE